MSKPPYDYTVLIEDSLPPETPCGGCSCGADYTFADLAPIGDCCLTPGDGAPAGRCPHCGDIAYVVDKMLLEMAAPALKGSLSDCIDQMEQCESMFRDDVEFMAALNRARAAFKAAGA